MPKNSKLKDTTCKRPKCFAKSKDGKCTILYDSDFGYRKCPFYKAEASVTNGRVYPFDPSYSHNGIPIEQLPVKRSDAVWAEEWDAVTEPIRRKLQGA